MFKRLLALTCLACCLTPAVSSAQVARRFNRIDYENRLHGMWLGEVIGNWTGLAIEGAFSQPPFLTDADWGQVLAPGRPPLTYVFQNPWRSDDDTDIEYVYVNLLARQQNPWLTSEDIVQGWMAHINHHIWNSNRNARTLMGRGVYPPATSLGACNLLRMLISAQLTVEMFGAMNPGMPERALEMADAAIHTTAGEFAVHACQFYVVLYSLASVTPEGLTDAQKVEWLVRQARRYIPDTSKTAGAADFVLAHFLANPDIDNWESTRDAIYDRYQLHAAENGFAFYGFSDSTVNFAAGIMSLLYGQGDYRRTMQIGTLAGWDCDNQPATMGGLLGLMQGYDRIFSQFPGQSISDRFTVRVTRDNLPDYLPHDPAAEDTLRLLSIRMADITERIIARNGGVVDRALRVWVLPPSVAWNTDAPADAILFNPSYREFLRSNTLSVRRQGGVVVAASSAGPSSPPYIFPYNYGFSLVARLANGIEQDFAGRELNNWERVFYSTQNSNLKEGDPVTFTVTYDRDVPVQTVRFIEGDHPRDDLGHGGWMTSIKPQVLIGDIWNELPPETVLINPPDPDKPYQYIDWVLPHAVMARAVRITGHVGGPDGFATGAELDALSPPIDHPLVYSFDVNNDRVVNFKDYLAMVARPVDLNGDGVVTSLDVSYLLQAIRPTAEPPRPALSR
ncbi:MAG: ADP-ribosylglycohydrolase family protein [Pyrinomonadaceae bacterium]|nr:ADP-ribosylglycohydrolase family protein [Phycisphaerales bacterium]